MALSESKYFRMVPIGAEADIELLVEIISCRPENEMQSRYQIVVDYKFVERRSGKVVWEDTINTVYSSNAFSGNTRVHTIKEGVVRENLAKLLSDISTQWPQEAR